MIKAEDLGRYFRIPADNRDLNYGKYFSEGVSDMALTHEYTSHNTTRLDVDGTKRLLLTLDIIKKDVGTE
jgi:UDP-glucose 4-epimerase